MLHRTAAWPRLTSAATGRSGVWVATRDALDIATLMAARNKGSELVERIARRLGAKLPIGPRREVSGQTAFIGVSPGAWMVTRESGSANLAQALTQEAGDIAAVVDQSDAYSVLRVGGAHIRSALCKLVSVDLHPAAFGIGDSAVTTAAHMGLTLWRLDDDTSASSVFELAVARSMAGSFWEAFAVHAEEFGLVIAK